MKHFNVFAKADPFCYICDLQSRDEFYCVFFHLGILTTGSMFEIRKENVINTATLYNCLSHSAKRFQCSKQSCIRFYSNM